MGGFEVREPMKSKAFEGFSKKPAVGPQRAKAGVKVHLCRVGERSRDGEVERWRGGEVERWRGGKGRQVPDEACGRFRKGRLTTILR